MSRDKKRSMLQQEQQKESWNALLHFRRLTGRKLQARLREPLLPAWQDDLEGVKRTRIIREILTLATHGYQSSNSREPQCVVQQNHTIEQLYLVLCNLSALFDKHVTRDLLFSNVTAIMTRLCLCRAYL